MLFPKESEGNTKSEGDSAGEVGSKAIDDHFSHFKADNRPSVSRRNSLVGLYERGLEHEEQHKLWIQRQQETRDHALD